MLEFDTIQSTMVVLLLLVAGEFLSKKMKAIFPTALVAGALFLVGIWAGLLPEDLVERTGLPTLTSLAMMMVIVNMGATSSLRELARNWRVVALSAGCFVLEVLFMFLVVGTVFDLNTAVSGLPGGSAVALIVQERARALGHEELVILSVLIVSIQGTIACPVVALCVKKEAARLCALDASQMHVTVAGGAPARKTASGSINFSLLRLLVCMWLATRLEMLTGISRYVLCLLLSVLAAEVGWLRRDELKNAQSEGFFILVVMMVIFSGFASITPQRLLLVLAPFCCILACEVGGIFLFSLLLGKLFHTSRAMSVAIGMQVMIGFPLNLMISQDIIGGMTQDGEQRAFLMDQIATKLILAGFTSVTFLATIAAGLLVTLMT